MCKGITPNGILLISESSENGIIKIVNLYNKTSKQKSKIRVVNDILFTDLIILDTVFNTMKVMF